MCRFLGIDPLVHSFCSTNKMANVLIDYNREVQFDSYLNPLALIVCYYTLVITSGLLLDSTVISLTLLQYFNLHIYSQALVANFNPTNKFHIPNYPTCCSRSDFARFLLFFFKLWLFLWALARARFFCLFVTMSR